MDEKDQKSPERMFGELMAAFGSEALSKILNSLEVIKRQRLDEIGQLDQTIAAKREEIIVLKRYVEDLSNKSAELGRQYLRIKEKFRGFVLGPDEPFSQEKVDAFEHVLDERLTAQREQP
jgi:hypothetical protein